MTVFLARHRPNVKGVLSGWDRIRFRGSLRPLSYVDGMMKFLSNLSVLLKDFRVWAQSLTDLQRKATRKFAADAGRPVQVTQCGSPGAVFEQQPSPQRGFDSRDRRTR